MAPQYWHINTDAKLVTTVPEDAIAPKGARASAGDVMSMKSYLYLKIHQLS